MKISLILLGSLLACVAFMFVVGSVLPRGHLVSRRARYRVAPDAIFAVITNFAAGPSWRPSLKAVDILPAREGKQAFREAGSNGSLVFVVDELAPPTRLVTRIVDNAAFGGTWTFELLPASTGSVLAISERGEVYNPFFRFMGRFFFSQASTMDAYLLALGRKFGENAVPEPGVDQAGVP